MWVADVMILADVFETFPNISLTKGIFEIDAIQCWDAMLKKCRVTLDLITDLAVYIMIEGGMGLGSA